MHYVCTREEQNKGAKVRLRRLCHCQLIAMRLVSKTVYVVFAVLAGAESPGVGKIRKRL